MISIIVPVYNKEKYLNKCLDSLVNQTYRDIEIILVDDGSIDDSGRICDQYALDYSFVQVIHKENGGPSSAWKAGLSLVKGDYVAFVDSDDWVDLDMMERMVARTTGISTEIITCDHTIDYKDGSYKQMFQGLTPGEYYREQIEDDLIPKLLGSENRLITLSRCMKLISRELVSANIDFCDDSILMGDDSTITLPCILDATRIYALADAPMYHYLYVEDSIVHRYDDQMYENNCRLFTIYENIFKAKLNNSSALLNKCLDNCKKEFLFLLLLCVKNEVRGNEDGFREKIKLICKEQGELIQNCKIEVHEKANILLYWTLKKPDFIRLSLLRLAILVYYR